MIDIFPQKEKVLAVAGTFPLAFLIFGGVYLKKEKYIYEGPIMVFDKCVQSIWKSETMAESRSKAISNLCFQAKKLCNLVSNTRLTLPGNLYLMKGGAD